MSKEIFSVFRDAANSWLCDGYTVDLTFFAERNGDASVLWDAQILMNPLPNEVDYSFCIKRNRFTVGQIQRRGESKSFLMKMLDDAAECSLPLADCRLVAPSPTPYYSSEMSIRDRWSCPLQLNVVGSQRDPLPPTDLLQIDNELRLATPPFDGLDDALRWLNLQGSQDGAMSTKISIRVAPPVDLRTDESALANDELTLVFHAHPLFDVNRIGLGIRVVPGVALDARFQASEHIRWSDVQSGRRIGVATISVAKADQALIMLMISGTIVRRHWIIDKSRARNDRYLAMQLYDTDLRMVRQGVFGDHDSARFEKGVAALLFLLGFSPAVQLETDAPDIVVASPQGRLLIIECTTVIRDFSAKLGKLVDRRGALVKQLALAGHNAPVTAVLVCRLPRNQIAAQPKELQSHGVVLVSGEDLQEAFNKIRAPEDPDSLLDSLFVAANTGISQSE